MSTGNGGSRFRLKKVSASPNFVRYERPSGAFIYIPRVNFETSSPMFIEVIIGKGRPIAARIEELTKARNDIQNQINELKKMRDEDAYSGTRDDVPF